MDIRSEIREFLTTRRARITPQQAGLPVVGGHRRVPGLRREEVALLAGVSIDYYNRLERGGLGGVSDGVLDALAAALRLDEAERAHLLDLARAVAPSRSAGKSGREGEPSAQECVRPSVARVLETITGAPAFVRTSRSDLLAANPLGRALYDELFEDPDRVPNMARYVYLDPRSQRFYGDWETVAADMVASLRATLGRAPHDRALGALVEELSAGSGVFRTHWARHDVRLHRTGTKHIRHAVVGDLHLTYESMELPADPGLTIVTYHAEAGSPSQDGLDLLAGWWASRTDPAGAPTRG